MERKSNQLIKTLKAGGIVVMPSDTIYGLMGSALNSETVERLYRVRKRAPTKPSIILIDSLERLKDFDIDPGQETRAILTKFWPGKVSVILPCPSSKFQHLHRGTKTLAFRIPKPSWLQSLLKATGPLIAPSANPEGLPPARTLKEAKTYFGDQVDLYISGRTNTRPSTVIKLENDQITILREGAVKIKRA